MNYNTNKNFDVKEVTNNFKLDAIEVMHQDLERIGDSMFTSQCPNCDIGVLLVRRHQTTFDLLTEDACINCGRRFKYVDIVEFSRFLKYKEQEQ